jgi:hypothetical protein
MDLIVASTSKDDTDPIQYHVPKIYFATRTHSQITQVVKELKSTKFRPIMSILSGRDYSCIHPIVSTSKSKNNEWYSVMISFSLFYYYISKQLLQSKIGCAWRDNSGFLVTNPSLLPGTLSYISVAKLFIQFCIRWCNGNLGH